MNKFFKKLAVLLSFVMVFTAMPMSVFAEAALPNAEVKNLGSTTVDVESYYKYDLIGGSDLSTGTDCNGIYCKRHT